MKLGTSVTKIAFESRFKKFKRMDNDRIVVVDETNEVAILEFE